MTNTENINPLRVKRLEMSYDEMAKKMEVHINSIWNVARMDEERVGNLKLKVIKKYRDVLGVDLIKYSKYYKD